MHQRKENEQYSHLQRFLRPVARHGSTVMAHLDLPFYKARIGLLRRMRTRIGRFAILGALTSRQMSSPTDMLIHVHTHAHNYRNHIQQLGMLCCLSCNCNFEVSIDLPIQFIRIRALQLLCVKFVLSIQLSKYTAIVIFGPIFSSLILQPTPIYHFCTTLFTFLRCIFA